MHRRLLLALLSCLVLAAPMVRAQEGPPQPLPRVALQTSLGTIVIELETVRAPITAANFLAYVDQGRLEGTTFYRAMQGYGGSGLIQGGTNQDRERTLPPIPHEPTTQTGLSHVEGAVSMPRFEPGTAAGDFTIMVGNMTYLDARPAADGDNLGYAVFGRVVQGMEVVRAILAAPVSATEGEGVMLGQMLEPRIVIERVWRVED
ncbi:MAG: peptidylprolyl isomerase [Caulobacterales bacterium]|nr:peptidylprolyl isomerase [Caulobacterales bacterium]